MRPYCLLIGAQTWIEQGFYVLRYLKNLGITYFTLPIPVSGYVEVTRRGKAEDIYGTNVINPTLHTEIIRRSKIHMRVYPTICASLV